MTSNRVISVSLLGVVFLFVMTSCSKLATLINKTLVFSTPTQNFSIPPISDTVVLLSSVYSPSLSGSFNYNIDSCIKANTGGALGIHNISSFKINSGLFTVTNPTATSNFQALQSVSVAFTSSTNSTPYMLSVNQPNVYATTMTLLPVDTAADMKSYIQGNTFNYTITGKMRSGTTDTMKCTAVFTFTVKVQG